jgi:hypothetical protein
MQAIIWGRRFNGIGLGEVAEHKTSIEVKTFNLKQISI